MGNTSGEESSASDESMSNKDLFRRLNKLERKLKKYKKQSKKRRTRSRSSSRSSNGRQSYSRSRSRARSTLNRGSPERYYSRDYRSPSGYESRRAKRKSTESDCSVPADISPCHNDSNAAENSNIDPNSVAREDSQVLEIHDNEEISDEWLRMLGDDPQSNKQNALDLHPAVSSRWGHIINNGLSNEVREELYQKYPFPANCELLIPPQINAEIVNILPNFHIKRDKSHIDMQTRVCKGMSALGKGISLLLENKGDISKEHKENLLACFGDAGKMFADLVHHSSQLRRTLIMPQMSKSARDMAEKTTAGQYLFGSDFGEKIKEIKIMERTSKDLKPSPPSTSKVPIHYKKTLKDGEGGKLQRYRALTTSTRENLNRGRPARRPREARPHKGHSSKSRTNYSWRNR